MSSEPEIRSVPKNCFAVPALSQSTNTATAKLLRYLAIMGGLVVPWPVFSATLSATPNNSRVALVWNSITGATSYNVKHSLAAAGPFTTVANLTGTNFVDAPLLNGVNYFFTVAAVTNAVEFTNTVVASATPFIASGTPAMMYGDSVQLQRPFAKDPTVVRFQGRYLMYYSQKNTANVWSVGIAVSQDLINWTRAG